MATVHERSRFEWRGRWMPFAALVFAALPAGMLYLSALATIWLVLGSDSVTFSNSQGEVAGRVGVSVLYVLVLVLAASSTRPDVLGAQLPRLPGRVRSALMCVALTLALLAGLLVVGLTSLGLGTLWGVEAPEFSRDAGWEWDGLNLATVLGLSVFAGLVEEVAFVALPTTAAAIVRGALPAQLRGRSVMTWMIAAGVAGLLCRSLLHVYQGWVQASAVLVWGALMLAVYLTWKSVYPLIAAHILYDFLIAGIASRTPDWQSIHATVHLSGALSALVVLAIQRRSTYERLIEGQ